MFNNNIISAGFAMNSTRPEDDPAVVVAEHFNNNLKQHQVF